VSLLSFVFCGYVSKMNDANDRWRDDVWTMKYLSGFKWEMLGEQVGMSTFQISSYALSNVSVSEWERS
jgi:ESF2/ABP1 family protein